MKNKRNKLHKLNNKTPLKIILIKLKLKQNKQINYQDAKITMIDPGVENLIKRGGGKGIRIEL